MIELELLYIIIGWVCIYILGEINKRIKGNIDIVIWILGLVVMASSSAYLLIGFVTLLEPIITRGG